MSIRWVPCFADAFFWCLAELIWAWMSDFPPFPILIVNPHILQFASWGLDGTAVMQGHLSWYSSRYLCMTRCFFAGGIVTCRLELFTKKKDDWVTELWSVLIDSVSWNRMNSPPEKAADLLYGESIDTYIDYAGFVFSCIKEIYSCSMLYRYRSEIFELKTKNRKSC